MPVQCLIAVWHSLQQNVIDTAISEWRNKRLKPFMHADGQSFEHSL